MWQQHTKEAAKRKAEWRAGDAPVDRTNRVELDPVIVAVMELKVQVAARSDEEAVWFHKLESTFPRYKVCTCGCVCGYLCMAENEFLSDRHSQGPEKQKSLTASLFLGPRKKYF